MRLTAFPLVATLLLQPGLPLQAGEEKLVETIEVRITNVDVVVTDRKGSPVAGLTRDDFVLTEDGQPQLLTNFYEVTPPVSQADQSRGAASSVTTAADEVPIELRRRRVIFFIDNYSLNPIRRNEMFLAVDRFFEHLLQPGDEAMIVTWNRGLHVVQPFTTNQPQLRQAIQQVSSRSGGGPTIDAARDRVKQACLSLLEDARQKHISFRSAYDQSISIARAHAEEVYSLEHFLAQSMSLMLATLAGVEGKKVMVFAGAQLPAQPALDLFQWIDQNYAQDVPNFAPSALANGSERSMTGELERVARRANASGVTLYMIDAAEGTSASPASAGASEQMDPTSDFLTFSGTALTYGMMARLTGGVALMRTHNFDQAMTTLSRELSSYYSLGYRAGQGTKGDRSLRITVRNRAYLVRSRATYVSKSAEEQVRDRVVSNIFHSEIKSDLAITARTSPPVRQSRRVWRVPLEVLVPPNLVLLPQGNLLAGGFDVYIAVGDSDGLMSAVSKVPQPIRIPPAAENALRKNAWIFRAAVDVREGEHYLSIAVVDQITGASGFVRTKVIAP